MKIINRKQIWKDIKKGNCRGKQIIFIREHWKRGEIMKVSTNRSYNCLLSSPWPKSKSRIKNNFFLYLLENTKRHGLLVCWPQYRGLKQEASDYIKRKKKNSKQNQRLFREHEIGYIADYSEERTFQKRNSNKTTCTKISNYLDETKEKE